MGREERLTNPRQYSLVYKKGDSWVSSLLVMVALPNDLNFSRYGFSVSKRVGKAVIRNRIKRQLREVLRTNPINAAQDIVFIVRPAAAGADYANLKKSVESLLSRANFPEAEDKEESPNESKLQMS